MSELHPANFTEDKLNLLPFCSKLEEYIKIDHDFVEESLVTSLDAPFGSGKTTFLTMWKVHLENRRETDKTLPLPIILNAWESDYCGDPLLAVIAGLLKAATQNSMDGATALREAAKDVAWYSLGIGNEFVKKWTGIDPVGAGKFTEEKRAARKPIKPDFVRLYEQRSETLKKLKTALRAAFGGEQPRALVLVDELDRCRPDYAIHYLETIKHVFDIHGLVFVLAVDRSQLENSAKALFGPNLNFPEYFRKFSQRTFTLPNPGIVGSEKLIIHYLKLLLQKEGKRKSKAKFDNLKDITQLVEALRMTPRQLQEVFRIIGHAYAENQHTMGSSSSYQVLGTILMVSMKIVHPDLYAELGTGRKNHTEFAHFLRKILGPRNSIFWLCLYLSGVGNDEFNPITVNAEALIDELKIDTSFSRYPILDRIGSMSSHWSSYTNNFRDIYSRIEGAMTFEGSL